MTLHSFRTDAERKAFMCGVAFYIGSVAYKHHQLTLDEFQEREHPRGEAGRFVKTQGSSHRTTPTDADFEHAIDEVASLIKNKSNKQLAREAKSRTAGQDYGREIKINRGDNPIHALILTKEGHIKSAYQRPDIKGLEHIDLFWGNTSAGLVHIIKRRLGTTQNKEQVKRVLKNLNDVIRHGRLRQDLSNDRSVVLQYNNTIAVVSLSYKNDVEKQAVITGYEEF